jgi:hypothetical protein
MTAREWKAIALVLSSAFAHREPWDEDRSLAYKMLLDSYPAGDVMTAIRTLAHKGDPFLPSAPEILRILEHDPMAPAFDDMLTAIYGKGGVLLAPPPNVFDARERAAAHDEACLERAAAGHADVAGFVGHVGLAWLRTRDVDSEFGYVHRRELRAAWDEWMNRSGESRAFALAAGRGPGRLSRVDGTRAIGAGDDNG